MKTTFLAATSLTLLHVTTAVPPWQFRHGSSPDSAHRQAHNKRAYVTDVVTSVTTVTGPQMVVWVDDQGDVVSTETRHNNIASSTVPPSTMPSMSAAETTSTGVLSSSMSISIVAVSPSNASANPTTLPTVKSLAPTTAPPASTSPASASLSSPSPSPSPSPPSSSTAAPASATVTPADTDRLAGNANSASSSSSSSASFPGHGIAYDILDASGQCKSWDTVVNDFTIFPDASLIRIYDRSCSQIQMVTAAAASHGKRVLISLSNADALNNLNAALDDVLSQAGSNLDVVDTISIGNEYVNQGGDPHVILGALSAARGILAGRFWGSLVVIDTFNQILSHPALCQQSDYCAINCHAFFDTTQVSSNAGPYVASVVQSVANANPGKKVVVTESGWPHTGDTNGAAVASIADQDAAMASLHNSFSQGIILFQAFDALYKQPGPLRVEQFWGMHDRS